MSIKINGASNRFPENESQHAIAGRLEWEAKEKQREWERKREKESWSRSRVSRDDTRLVWLAGWRTAGFYPLSFSLREKKSIGERVAEKFNVPKKFAIDKKRGKDRTENKKSEKERERERDKDLVREA